MNTSTNSVQVLITLLAQKFDQMNFEFVQIQKHIMNKLKNLERHHSAMISQFIR
jgi:hypothetical protein